MKEKYKCKLYIFLLNLYIFFTPEKYYKTKQNLKVSKTYVNLNEAFKKVL